MTDRQAQAQRESRRNEREMRRNGSPRPGAGAPRRRPRAWPTVLAALAIFGVAFEFLAFQLRAGHDPALGGAAAAPVATKAQPARKVIITKVIPASGTAATGSTSSTSSSSGSVAAPAPVSTSSS